MKSLYLLIIFFVFSSGITVGYQWRNQRAYLEKIQYEKDYNAAFMRATQQAREREQSLQKQMDVLTDETQQQLAEITALERAAADSRVRELAKTYAASHQTGADSSVTAHCQTERHRAAVLADLLAELDQLAEQFAATADRNRITGKACEAAYTAIYQTLP